MTRPVASRLISGPATRSTRPFAATPSARTASSRNQPSRGGGPLAPETTATGMSAKSGSSSCSLWNVRPSNSGMFTSSRMRAGRPPSAASPGLPAVGGAGHPVALALQHRLHRGAGQGVVLNDKDCLAGVVLWVHRKPPCVRPSVTAETEFKPCRPREAVPEMVGGRGWEAPQKEPFRIG